jgi:hypothetical protein
VPSHINLAATKHHSFSLQTQALLNGMIAAQFYFSSRAQNAVPGQTKRGTQGRYHVTCVAGKPRGFGHSTITANHA